MLVQNTEFGGVQKRHCTRDNPHQFTTVDAFLFFIYGLLGWSFLMEVENASHGAWKPLLKILWVKNPIYNHPFANQLRIIQEKS